MSKKKQGLRRKYRELRAQNLARSRAAGVPAGEVAESPPVALPSRGAVKAYRKAARGIAWLHGRQIISTTGSKRAFGSFESGKRR